MQTSEKGLALIKEFESCQLKAYRCPAGVWTIGYGHTHGVCPGDVCTSQQAEKWLKTDCRVAEMAIAANVNVPLTQNKFDALVSFIFNVGSRNFSTSTLLKKLNACDYAGAADEFLRWNKSRGKVLNGLVRRRAAERELFLS